MSSGYSYYEKKLLTKWINLEYLKLSEEVKSFLMHICTLPIKKWRDKNKRNKNRDRHIQGDGEETWKRIKQKVDIDREYEKQK